MENANPYTDKLNPWSSHKIILAMLEQLPDGSRVLDVGAASGTLARLSVSRRFVLRGIEPNAEWLGDADKLYEEIFYGALEQTPDDYLAGNSAVVCGDVLEHLVQPTQQLVRLVKAQPENCLFIISVPNIANLWMRLNLLLGHFDYSDKGILDGTHLHFYTRKTFLGLLNQAGLQVRKLQVTPIPLDLVNPFFNKNAVGKIIYKILAQATMWWPTLLGY